MVDPGLFFLHRRFKTCFFWIFFGYCTLQWCVNPVFQFRINKKFGAIHCLNIYSCPLQNCLDVFHRIRDLSNKQITINAMIRSARYSCSMLWGTPDSILFYFFHCHWDCCKGMTAVGERERGSHEGRSKWAQLMLHALVWINLYFVMTNTMPS